METCFEVSEPRLQSNTSRQLIDLLRNNWILRQRQSQMESDMGRLQAVKESCLVQSSQHGLQRHSSLKKLEMLIEECDEIIKSEKASLEAVAPYDSLTRQNRKWVRRIEKIHRELESAKIDFDGEKLSPAEFQAIRFVTIANPSADEQTSQAMQ